MPNTANRNQRNNPYQLEELFVKFHRTPAGHRLAVAHRTTHPHDPDRRFWRFDTWTSAHLGR